MIKPSMIALAVTLALSAAPAMAGVKVYNTVSANALTDNALTDNALTDNAVTDNAIAHIEVRLLGATGEPVAAAHPVVLRLIRIELPARH